MVTNEFLAKVAERSRQAYAQRMEQERREAGRADGMATRILVATGVGETEIYLYRPLQSKRTGPLPVFVNIHGGGFIQGSPGDDDPWCRQIADAVDCAVVSIDYHLAPEYRFPVTVYECYDVIKWLHDQAVFLGMDPGRIAVGGHSAGGNLAAALTLLARERREFSLGFQVLNYPVLDFVRDPYEKVGKDLLLTAKAQSFFSSCYLEDAEAAKNPLASPILAESFAGLPPALVIAAEFDPLRVENERYAEALKTAGVTVTFHLFPGCMHAFTHFGPETAANEAWRLIQDSLRQAFWGREAVFDGER